MPATQYLAVAKRVGVLSTLLSVVLSASVPPAHGTESSGKHHCMGCYSLTGTFCSVSSWCVPHTGSVHGIPESGVTVCT